ncbi:MAG: hypothetical protein N4A72_00370 [Bacteroidales bacterium]|jgi:hypothetical protein|nr:hypothetical protein [Bacteroidales bacterium]
MIELTGHITKLEKLITLSANILPNTMVLENEEPYPGYHNSAFPNSLVPQSVFLITQDRCSMEKVYRATEKVKECISYSFQATPCTIMYNHVKYDGIRIKYIDDISRVEDLQKRYQVNGIFFRKYKKIDGQAYIRVKKPFMLDDFCDDDYKSSVRDNKWFICLEKEIEFDEFDQITRHVKNNVINNNFDAALVSVFKSYSVIDMVRIVGEMSEKDILEIKSVYNREIMKL